MTGLDSAAEVAALPVGTVDGSSSEARRPADRDDRMRVLAAAQVLRGVGHLAGLGSVRWAAELRVLAP